MKAILCAMFGVGGVVGGGVTLSHAVRGGGHKLVYEEGKKYCHSVNKTVCIVFGKSPEGGYETPGVWLEEASSGSFALEYKSWETIKKREDLAAIFKDNQGLEELTLETTKKFADRNCKYETGQSSVGTMSSATGQQQTRFSATYKMICEKSL